MQNFTLIFFIWVDDDSSLDKNLRTSSQARQGVAISLRLNTFLRLPRASPPRKDGEM
jgi:hypothetical protein